MLLRLGLSIGPPTCAFQFIRVCQRVRLSPHAAQLLELCDNAWISRDFQHSLPSSQYQLTVCVRVFLRVCVLRQNKWRKELHMQIVCIAARPAYRARHLPFWLWRLWIWLWPSSSAKRVRAWQQVSPLLCSPARWGLHFTPRFAHCDKPKPIKATKAGRDKSNRAATIAKMCCKKSNSLLTVNLKGFFEVFSKLNHL